MRTIFAVLILLFSILTLTNCSVSKELREERKDWQFSRWQQEYKDRALCLCVLQGINNKSIQDSIVMYDKSFYNPLGIAIFDSSINELLKKEVKQIQADSARSIGRVPADIRHLLEGKKVMRHCTEFYRSKRLDSAANVEKKNWKHITSIMGKIHDKIPTY